MSANYVSLTLIAKDMIEIQIVLPSLTLNVDYIRHACPLWFITIIQIQFKSRKVAPEIKKTRCMYISP